MSTVQRRLSAIVCADVAGYSRLMGMDEAGTLATLKQHRQAVDPIIAASGGRIVKTTGDGLLIEFPSVVDAVRASLDAQRTMAERNAGFSEDRRMLFRIGAHIGDVIIEGDDIFGDGVNIAARLQEVAEPGGVCVSQAVHDSVRNKVDAGFVDGGEQTLKNIAAPVRVWRWSPLATSAPASTTRARHVPLSLPDKPSIAVLPFTNMSGDQEQEYFCDGISEDLITALARFPSLLVIARNSTFTYKGKAVDVRQVSRGLGVRYVLEGSIRKAGNRLRITGQLIQAETGVHVWAERYDGEIDDVFALQDRITEAVTAAIAPSVERAEIERARRKVPENLDAYDLYLRALPLARDMTRAGNDAAIELLRRAIALDPSFPSAVSMLALSLTFRIGQGWSHVSEVGAEAVELGRRARQLDRDDPDLLAQLARSISYIEGNQQEALTLTEQALRLNPNSATVLLHSGWVHLFAGQADGAETNLRSAIRLNPNDLMDFDVWGGLAIALIQGGRDREAIDAARKSIERNPNYTVGLRALASALAHAGQKEEARAAVQRLVQIDPSTISAVKARSRFADAWNRYFDGARLAGLPE